MASKMVPNGTTAHYNLSASGDHAHAASTSHEPTREQQAEIGSQGRTLLNIFVAERLRDDGIQIQPGVLDVVPTEPPPENIRRIAEHLRQIGDELDRDQHLQGLIARIEPHPAREVFMRVAREIFSDGKFNWGRVVALFYLAYRLIRNVCDHVLGLSDRPFIQTILEWATSFLVEWVAPWIIARGGWIAVVIDLDRFWIVPLRIIMFGVAIVALHHLMR